MAAGEYIGSKSQREIFDAQIVDEREEVHERPGEAEAEVAYMFDGGRPATRQGQAGGAVMAEHPDDAQDDGREGARAGGRGAARVAAAGRRW